MGLVRLLSQLQYGWGIVGHVMLGLGITQRLMQQECGLQAAALMPNIQELLDAFNRLKLVWLFGFVGFFSLVLPFCSAISNV